MNLGRKNRKNFIFFCWVTCCLFGVKTAKSSCLFWERWSGEWRRCFGWLHRQRSEGKSFLFEMRNECTSKDQLCIKKSGKLCLKKHKRKRMGTQALILPLSIMVSDKKRRGGSVKTQPKRIWYMHILQLHTLCERELRAIYQTLTSGAHGSEIPMGPTFLLQKCSFFKVQDYLHFTCPIDWLSNLTQLDLTWSSSQLTRPSQTESDQACPSYLTQFPLPSDMLQRNILKIIKNGILKMSSSLEISWEYPDYWWTRLKIRKKKKQI